MENGTEILIKVINMSIQKFFFVIHVQSCQKVLREDDYPQGFSLRFKLRAERISLMPDICIVSVSVNLVNIMISLPGLKDKLLHVSQIFPDKSFIKVKV